MYTKQDRIRDKAILEAQEQILHYLDAQSKLLETLVSAVGTVDLALNNQDKKLDAALEAAHDMGLNETIQAGINNILSYTGAPKKETGA